MATLPISQPEEIDRADAIGVWRNNKVPVVFKPTAPRDVMVHLPIIRSSAEWFNYRDWLLGRGRKIRWLQRYGAFELPRGRFDEVVGLVLAFYGSVYIIQESRPLEKCAPACWNAKGYDCECSCLGSNHGSGRDLEHVISETCAFEWGERRLSCRLLKRK